ncbi:MAG: hypothetical protein OEW36_12425, partial [Hylemonella sp.]|nr:hypothetical protein [Hylemonella sp.]
MDTLTAKANARQSVGLWLAVPLLVVLGASLPLWLDMPWLAWVTLPAIGTLSLVSVLRLHSRIGSVGPLDGVPGEGEAGGQGDPRQAL